MRQNRGCVVLLHTCVYRLSHLHVHSINFRSTNGQAYLHMTTGRQFRKDMIFQDGSLTSNIHGKSYFCAQNQREDFHVHEYILDQQASAVWYVLKMCNEYWMTNLFLRMSLREAATV